MAASFIDWNKLHKNMLNKDGPKIDPCRTSEGKSFQQLKEVFILLPCFLSYMNFRDIQSKPEACIFAINIL